MNDVLKRLRDALEQAAGQYGQPSNEQRNEWMGLVQEVDGAAWFVYILGSSNRLAPPRTARSAPRQGDFVAAAGGFMARRLDRRATGLLLIEEWLDEVRRARGLPRGAPLWAELEATPTLARRVHEELHAFQGALTSGRAVNLVRLHNTLKEAREAIG